MLDFHTHGHTHKSFKVIIILNSPLIDTRYHNCVPSLFYEQKTEVKKSFSALHSSTKLSLCSHIVSKKSATIIINFQG